MLEAIEKLLILQESDRRLIRLRAEVADVGPQRRLIEQRQVGAENDHENARQQVLRLETERKKLELEAGARKEKIDKYSAQQWQTKKNEEYKALSHEIENCKREISKFEDDQLALMEQIEAAEKRLADAAAALRKAKSDCQLQIEQLATTELRLTKQLAEAEAQRNALAESVDGSLRTRYERLLKSKGGNIIVSVERGVCGGCHMKLARQDVLNTQAAREIIHCPNCGRILYYTAGMDVKPLE
jgi:predicted  nucleic acid-binding Zn-ribbon protein